MHDNPGLYGLLPAGLAAMAAPGGAVPMLVDATICVPAGSLVDRYDYDYGASEMPNEGPLSTVCPIRTCPADSWRASGQDDDGKSADLSANITSEQAKEIADKCKEVSDTFDANFCSYFGIVTIADLPAKEYQRALIAISKKKGAAK